MTRGDGPGEVQAPVAVTWVDANTLLVLDVGAFRITTLDLASHSASVTEVDPAFLSPVFTSGQVRFVALQPDRTVWLEFPGPVEDGWEERSFVRWSPDKPVNDTVMWSRARGFAGATLAAWPRSLLGVGAETWVVSKPDGRYELEVFDRNGTSLVRFCHTGEALPLSPAERGEDTDAEMPGGWRDTLRKLGEPRGTRRSSPESSSTWTGGFGLSETARCLVHSTGTGHREPCMTYSSSPVGFLARSAFRTNSDCWKREGAGYGRSTPAVLANTQSWHSKSRDFEVVAIVGR